MGISCDQNYSRVLCKDNLAVYLDCEYAAAIQEVVA